MKKRRRTLTKAALLFSLTLLVVWAILGTNASVAWFKQEDTLVNNLHFGDLDVELYHKTSSGYVPTDNATDVFGEAALYEPGYTQIVYLQIKNAGTLTFNYDMSVVPDLASETVGKNRFGTDILLHDHLKFGLVFDTTEEGLLQKTADRSLAQTYATMKLSDYSGNGGTLAAGETNYCALVLYMPEEVSDEANYRGDTVPSVNVGIGVTANPVE